MKKVGLVLIVLLGLTGCGSQKSATDNQNITVQRGVTGIGGQHYLRVVYKSDQRDYLIVDSLTINDIEVPVGWASSEEGPVLSGFVMLDLRNDVEGEDPNELIPHPKFGPLMGKDEVDIIIYLDDLESLVFEDVKIQ
ncbi:MAG: hypothetical protein HWE14_10895 [Flavobacteriia bacterium]|nr:hypothetical protein [Flavobacteriia bacterium]